MISTTGQQSYALATLKRNSVAHSSQCFLFSSLQEPHIKSNLAARPNIKMSAAPRLWSRAE